MMRKSVFAFVFALTIAAISAPFTQAIAMDMTVVEAGPLKISGAWAKAMLPGQPVGGGYLTIENTGAEPDRLVSVSSEATPNVQIHEMKMEGDVMKMRQLSEGLDIPPGGSVELKPGGYHLMFMNVKAPFEEGGTLKVNLKFEKAGEVQIELPVMAGEGDKHGG
jgi:periplasmic copper chaperone A